jgi:hypothetical protein
MLIFFTSASGRIYPVAISTDYCHRSFGDEEPVSAWEALPRIAS